MGFQLFPKRTPQERRGERRDALQAAGLFGLIALAGLGLTVLVAVIQPERESWWVTIGFIGLATFLIGLYLALQSVFEFTIAATIGMERAIAIVMVMVIAGGLLTWWSA